MKTLLLLCFVTLLVGFAVCDELKKSIYSNLPWPGYPFNRPPPGYFMGTTEDDGFYEYYDLGEEEEITDNDIDAGSKSDYRTTGAFQSSVASALHDFSFDLYSQMAQNWTAGQNGVISPLSIYTALCMLTLGLDGNSEAQAIQALHGDAFTDLHERMHEMSQVIFSDRSDVTMTKANRLYVDRSIRLLKDFKLSMKKDYKVTAKKVNFRSMPNLNRKRINRFVEKHTQSKIKNLAPEGSVTSDTRLFIVNAMYMKAFWMNSFYRTKKGDFYVSPGETIQANLMHTSGSMSCYSEMNNELDANVVRLEMKGGVSMIFVIPNVAGDFSLIEDSMGKARLRRALETLYDPVNGRWPDMCRVTLPKFTITHSADDLIACLKNMGMTDVFSPMKADLSKMTPGPEVLHVSDMRHKATIDVNENGLEASAATSIGISARMMPLSVPINRPFLFIVRDDSTGATLFTGRLVRPEAN